MKQKILAAALILFALAAGALGVFAQAASPPTQIMIVGTWHFENPGMDIHNMQADDVLAPHRQAEINEVVDSLSRFKPTQVAVEWPAQAAKDGYRAYLEDGHTPTRNEVEQLGFRLAHTMDLASVHGIDLPGAFPMDAVARWAEANGRGQAFGELMARAAALVAAADEKLRSHSIGQVLSYLNRPAEIKAGQALYLELLRYGEGENQPGAALNAAWQARNYRICARLLQSVSAGDRVVVFFGQGHAHALRRCVIDTPGVELVEPGDWLPKPAP